MGTVIRLKCDVSITGCHDCPFRKDLSIWYCGEITGEFDSNCSLLPKSNCLMEPDEEHHGCPYIRETPLDNCPIINVEHIF